MTSTDYKHINGSGLSHLMTKIKSWANGAFLKLSGGTLTGKLTLQDNQYTDDYTTGALNLRNSNIQGVNSIYTADGSGDATEGIHFYRDATHVDSIHAKSGELYFTPNRALGSAGTSEKVLRETSALKESLLTWGGKNFSNSYGPIDAAMINELGANRLAFSKPAGISIEYTRDGGATWLDYGWSDAYKGDLFAKGRGCPIGKYVGASELGQVTTDWKVRVTLNTTTSGTYTVLNKFAFYVSTNGASGCYVTITARKKSDLDADNDTWITIANQVPIGGWSGWNIVNYPAGVTTHGNNASQYANIRFEFGIGGLSSPYANSLSINRIMGFGGVGWSTPSNMAADGHLYSYDSSQNATFPASIFPKQNNYGSLGNSSTKWNTAYATTFYGNLSGNVIGNVSGNVTAPSSVTTPTLTAGTRANTSTYPSGGLHVWDIRQVSSYTPANIPGMAANFLFANSYMPTSNWWGVLNVKGWDSNYATWQLAGYADSSDSDAARNMPLYVRVGTYTTWGNWRKILDASMLSSATNSSAEDVPATPKAVKAAYDLANTASTTAGQAMSAATGALAFKVTYSVEDGAVTCYAHVYSAGEEVTENYEDECFDWSMTLDGGASWVVLGTGKEMPLTVMTAFGGNVKCDFTPPES